MFQAQRILTLIMTSIETILVGGTIYGWSYMQNVLIEEGFFANVQNSTFQVERLNLVVTVSTTAGNLTSFFLGLMIDARGLWFSRTVILAMVAIAYVLFFLSSAFNDYIIFCGAIALVTGNLGIWTTNLQISDLFPGYQSFYGYLINGCAISSYFVFFVFNSLYFQFGLSFELIFCLAAALTLLSHIHTFVLIPSHCVKKSVPKNFKYGYKELRCFKLNRTDTDLDSENNNENGVTRGICNEIKPDQKTFGSDINEERKTVDCLKSKIYIELVARYSYHRLSIAFFFWGNLQNWVDSVTGEDEDVSQHLLFFYSVLILSAAVVSPLIGLSLDKLKSNFSVKSGLKDAENKINSLSNVLVDLCLLLFYISACIPLKPFFYLTFIFSLFHICILYGNLSCYLHSQFPAKNFGKLYTVALGVSSIVGLLQFPATILTVRIAGFFNVCLFFVGATFVVLLFSVRKLAFVFRKDRRSVSNFQVNSAYVGDDI